LLKEYGAIVTALNAENYPRIAELLDNFDEGLRAHLAREHVELYIYLEYILAKDTESFRQMHELRHEMDHISTAVMTFLNTYQNKQVSSHNSTLFRQQLENIGNVLGGRIQREESNLYSLYKSA
jgi:regulator of sigma D